jgi:hypothetical protein
MISLHRQGLSMQQRQTKVEQLYKLITSDAYTTKMQEATRLSDAILDLDVDEKKQHDKTWKQRGRLAINLKNTLRGIDDDVFAVVGGMGTEDTDVEDVSVETENEF